MSEYWKLFKRIYGETNYGIAVATATAALAAAATYLFRENGWLAALIAIAAFALVKTPASNVYSRRKESRQRKRKKAELIEKYDNFGHEEHAVVKAFVRHGGSVITWQDCNESSGFSHTGIRSLMNRGLIREGEIGEYGADTLALDTQLFEYAQEVVFKDLFREE